MTRQLEEQQAADELCTLNEAEIEAVSGGQLDIDLGPLGIFSFEGGCVRYTQVNFSEKAGSQSGNAELRPPMLRYGWGSRRSLWLPSPS